MPDDSPSASPGAEAAALLTELEPLPAPARGATAARRARALAADGRLDAVLTEMASLGPYPRSVAFGMAAAARAIPWLEAAISAPDPARQLAALRAARRLPVRDAVLDGALSGAPTAVRQAIYRIIRATGRGALAEALVPRVREEWGDVEAGRLLPACGAETVATWLPQLATAMPSWSAVARRHPDEVLAEAARQLAELPPAERERWWARRAGGLAGAIIGAPGAALDLLERFGPPGKLPVAVMDRLGVLLDQDPARTLRLLLARGRLGGPYRGPYRALYRGAYHGMHLRHGPLRGAVLRRIARLDLPERVAVGRAVRATGEAFARLLKALAPAEREGYFDAVTQGEDLTVAHLEESVLEVLPAARRIREARRQRTLAADRGDVWGALQMSAHLPLDEVVDELAAATRRPDPNERARAYRALVGCAARTRDRAAFAATLGGLTRLDNEQDPVRVAALTAISEVDPAMFTGEVVPALTRLATTASQARDRSWGTEHALSELATRLLRHHAVTGQSALIEWSLGALERLTTAAGDLPLGRLDQALRRQRLPRPPRGVGAAARRRRRGPRPGPHPRRPRPALDPRPSPGRLRRADRARDRQPGPRGARRGPRRHGTLGPLVRERDRHPGARRDRPR